MPKKCAFVDEEGVRCGITPTYNNRGETKRLYCLEHKKEEMVNIKSKTCLECNKQSAFNKEGETRGIYCLEHKKEGMINVVSITCLDCKKQPVFNKEGETKPLYCSKHKKEGMINVKDKPCLECKKQPAFNIEGNTKPLYCSVHKKEGMVNVVTKKCINCKKQALYNNEGNTKGLYCLEHKKEGMINVKSKTCLECNKIPSFNKESEKNGLYCLEHKKEGMINVRNKTCLECKKIPSFNKEGEANGIYCSKHKKDGMLDVISKTCKNEWCNTNVKNKYDGYCLNCFIHAHPDKPVSRNYKTKERCVVEYITSHFPDLSWVADKTITDGCSLRRPDLMLDLGYQVVIVEVDENQHIQYDCSCENKRVMQLSQDVSHRPLIMVRFNPDEYTGENGESVTSCWGVNKLGLCVVKKSKEKEWESRLERLREQVEYWTNSENATEKTVEIVELFYDCD